MFLLTVGSTSEASNLGWRANDYPFEKLPPKAQKLLKTLPHRAIDLETVIKSGMAKSDSFQSLIAAKAAIQANEWMAQGAIDTTFFASANYVDDRHEPMSSFAASNQQNRSFALGLMKGFSTGTRLTSQLSLGEFSYELPTGLGIPSPGTQSSGEFSIALSQDLWRNSFGQSTSRKLRAGAFMSAANDFAVTDQMENWFLQLSEVFYGAWLSQSQARAARSSVTRSERLAEITRIKLKRGTAERPDLLQVEANLASAKVNLQNAEKRVDDVWRKLVVTLKFPLEWLNISGMKVPVAIYPIPRQTFATCGKPGQISPPPAANSLTNKHQQMALAAKNSLEASQSEMSPELSLELKASGNSIDSESGTALNESIQGTHPQISALLKFSVPLSNSLAKGQALNAYKEQRQAEALASMEQSNLQIDWVNACANLFRAQSASSELKKAYLMQNERGQLEEKRFRNGRITAPLVIRAEEEATGAELIWLQSEVDLRKAAWQVKKLKGEIETYMTQLASTSNSSNK
ncbi:MAG: TolC family protein [Bdellovibrionales bacterium]|nr:TolC family protein [Bdellovibrionales bacterium]